MRFPFLMLPVIVGVMSWSVCLAGERYESFDRDPAWDGQNHRAGVPGAQPVRQFHVLVGFFNSKTINEWRTPNSLVLRLYGRGDVFYAYVEYATAAWRAGGDSPGGFATTAEPATGKKQLKGFAARGAPHTWSLTYDPDGNGGGGSLTVTIDDETAVCQLDVGHKQDGAVFDRFGLLNIPKSYDQGGEVWVDDVSINGQKESFDADPGWDAVGNRRSGAIDNYLRRKIGGTRPVSAAA